MFYVAFSLTCGDGGGWLRLGLCVELFVGEEEATHLLSRFALKHNLPRVGAHHRRERLILPELEDHAHQLFNWNRQEHEAHLII